MEDIYSSAALKKRRLALGVSQPRIVEIVKRLTRSNFTQQSLSKFEDRPNSRSKYAPYIDQALAILEHHGPDVDIGELIFTVHVTPNVGKRAEDMFEEFKTSPEKVDVLGLIQRLTNDELTELLIDFLPRLSREERISVAISALGGLEPFDLSS